MKSSKREQQAETTEWTSKMSRKKSIYIKNAYAMAPRQEKEAAEANAEKEL